MFNKRFIQKRILKILRIKMKGVMTSWDILLLNGIMIGTIRVD